MTKEDKRFHFLCSADVVNMYKNISTEMDLTPVPVQSVHPSVNAECPLSLFLNIA